VAAARAEAGAEECRSRAVAAAKAAVEKATREADERKRELRAQLAAAQAHDTTTNNDDDDNNSSMRRVRRSQLLVLLAQAELHEAQVEYDVAARELRAKDAEARHLDMRAVQVTHGNAGPPATRRAWGGEGGA